MAFVTFPFLIVYWPFGRYTFSLALKNIQASLIFLARLIVYSQRHNFSINDSVKMEIIFDWNILFRFLYWLNVIIALWIMVKVILGNRNPFATFAWAFLLLFLPFVGLLLYFFFGHDTRRRRYIHTRFAAQIQQRAQIACRSYTKREAPPPYQGLAAYLENACEASMATAEVELLPDTKIFMERLYEAVCSATEHIHLQFYIFESDECGTRLRDALVKKAREGVEVRIIYDSVGCWHVSPRFFDAVRCAGGYVEAFLKVHFPFLSKGTNYRNHRKIVVIDGKLGFVGGCNIADRYLRGINGGVWRDTMMAVKGYGVYGLQSSFLLDWYFANGSMICGRRYFPEPTSAGNAQLQIAMSNPVGQWRVVSSSFVMLLSCARNYVYIQTPYLMPNEQVITSMECAALAGVDVSLMIPERSDSRLADYASRSYLERLLKAGVKVYLYTAGMMHAKSCVSDDMLAVVGSANVDFRSFDYNFEVCAYVYDEAFARVAKRQFLDDVNNCRLLTLREFLRRPFLCRVKESLARLFSPIL